MKFSLTVLFLSTIITTAFSQPYEVGCKILTEKQVSEIFTATIKQELKLTFPIRRVYSYSDKSGRYYCILTQSLDSISPDNDTIHRRIRAVNLKLDSGELHKTWELNDHLEATGYEEYNIRFWTGYMDFKDYDHDSLIEPIIVYGTLTPNAFDDGRVKILIYYKGQKIAIRHQNSSFDEGRGTQVDNTFYDLPSILQTAVQQKMKEMMDDNVSIFPYGWEKAMKNKKTVFSERK
jgi:hypothetical protein